MLITRSRSQPTTEGSVFASTYGETAREIVTINTYPLCYNVNAHTNQSFHVRTQEVPEE